MTAKTLLLLFFGDATRDRRVQNFSRYFSELGWKVELLALTAENTSGPKKFFHYHRHIQKAVRKKQADVVMACDLYSLSAARWLKKDRRANVLIYDAREVYTELPSVAKSPIKKWIWKRLEQRGMMRTNIVIVNAPNDAQAICDVHGFLPRPVLVRNLPWWEPEISRDRTLLAQFDISSDAKTIVYLGGLTHGRGLPKLFEALKNIPVHLLIIGDGILRQELETLTRNNGLAEKIHFAGAIESNRAIEIVASCDAGICLVESISKSYELGLPSKIFEYMMCGIPIVANPLAQVKELFPNPDWLKYVDEKNIQSIEKGILDTLVNFDNSKIREQERNTALEKYHFECDAKDLARVLETFEK